MRASARSADRRRERTVRRRIATSSGPRGGDSVEEVATQRLATDPTQSSKHRTIGRGTNLFALQILVHEIPSPNRSDPDVTGLRSPVICGPAAKAEPRVFC